MRYDIRLTIDQDYGMPSDGARNHLRVVPAFLPGLQKVERAALKADPAPDERTERVDFWGNSVTEMAWHRPVTRLTFTVEARLDRKARRPQFDLSPPLHWLPAEIRAHQNLLPSAPHHFLSASPRVAAVPEIAAFAARLRRPGATVAQVIRKLGEMLHEEMTFDAEATDVTTLPAQAFAQRRGVCQDFSHIMIGALRSLGVPAGYVSGYLRTLPPEGQERLAGADAMHAWVRAWAGSEVGWIEYDPTNAVDAGEDHVVIAHGRDYGDVSPVKGSLRSSGTQEARHAVDVIPLAGPSAETP